MDPIQRKLGLIDKQLAGGDFHKRIIRTSPLVFVVAGLIVGIVLQEVLRRLGGDESRFVWMWVTLLSLFGGSAIVLFALQKGGSRPEGIAYTALVCFACIGAIRMISFAEPASNDISRFVGNEPKPAKIRGVIVTEPHVNRHSDWAFARFKPTDPTSSFYLKLTEAEAVDGWAQVSGTVRTQVDGPVLDLKAGDYIEAYCLLDRFKPPTNPGQFDTAGHLARRNVFVAASVKSRDGIQLLDSPPAALFAKVRAKIRQTAARALLDDLPSDGSAQGMLQALLLGYRGDIDSDTYRAFRRTGLLHFVSLSGMHFGILVGIVWWLCKTAGLMKPGRAVVCILAIALFLLVVPARAPTVRAAIMGWVFCASFLFRRRPNAMNTLSLAAIVLLLIRPTQLFEAGWQLSFGTVLGILLFEQRIKSAIDDAVERFSSELDFRKSWIAARLLRKAARTALPMFYVGLAAWLGGAGILLYHFGTITPLASIWTVLVFPLVGAILTLGFSKILLFFLLPTLSGILGVVVTGLSAALIWVVKLIGHAGSLHILIGHVPFWPVVLYYCFIVFVMFARFRRPVVTKAVCATTVLVIVVIVAGTKWRRTHTSELVLTCLDVSHGQAIFAQFPGGGNALFDAGSLHISDVGRRIVAPFLDYKAISRIDTVFISHNDIDHINGIPEVVESCETRRVYANEAFFEDAGQWGAAKFLNDNLNRAGLRIERVTAGVDFGGNVRIKSLWPNEDAAAEQFTENDKSLVLLIEFAGRRILLCSDIEKTAQKEIIRLNPDLSADVVVVPHHGSKLTTEPAFIKSLGANILIYSCGRRGYEGLREAERTGSAEHFYTPEHGAIAIRIGEDGSMRIETAARRD